MYLEVGTLDAAGYTALCAKKHFVAYFYVSRNTHLATKHAPLPHFRAAGNAHLRRHHCVGTHFYVMADLHEVVQFHPLMYLSTAHGRTVYTSVCTHFHVVFKLYNSYLWYLVVTIGPIGSKSKAIGSDDCSCVKGYAVS